MTFIKDPVEEAKGRLVEMKERIYSQEITPEAFKFYANCYTLLKDKVDTLAAEIEQGQDKIRLINDIICDINNLTDDKNGNPTDAKNGVDLTHQLDLQEKLRVAKELGVNISPDKLTYSPLERDRLIQNLQLKADEWDKENRTKIQKVEILIKELDRIMIMLKEIQKCEDRPKRSAAGAIKGS